MATLKRSGKKKKIIIAVAVLLVIAIVATSLLIYKSKSGKESVSLYTISTSDIYETVSATGDITSGATREYAVSSIATVKEVFVSEGDEVKAGDMLATFDTSALDAEIQSLQNTYNNAKTSYNESLKSQNEAKSKLKDIEASIAKLEKQIAGLEKSITNSVTTKTTAKKAATTTRKAATTTQKSTTTAQKTSTTATTTTTTTTTTTAQNSSTESTSAATLQDLVASINALVTTINQISADLETATQLLQVAVDALNEVIQGMDTSDITGADIDAIASAVGDAVAQAIQQGIIDETKLLVDSGEAVALIEAAVKSIDWATIATQAAGVIAENDSVELASLEVSLSSLYIQKELYTLVASGSTVEAQKEILDASASALNALKASGSELSAGWTAAFDGTITSCDITPGEQVSLLSNCITLENLNSMVVTVSLNEYDIHKVSVGMDCTITTAYGKYTGRVTGKALVATGGSTGSILDSIGSIAGISGLSSLTDSGAGVEVQITVDEPDENIIIGFEANVEISTGEYIGVTAVPIESLILEKTGTFVYLYDEEEGTVTKTPVTTGAISDSVYQVTEGVSVGDKIIATPSSGYEEDTFEVKVLNSAS